MATFAIGDVARRTGVKVSTIRYYESIGLLPRPERTASNRRTYGEQLLQRLSFIRHSRELGFEIPAIRELLGLADSPTASCADADSIARQRLHEIESKLERLQALRAEIQGMVDTCSRGRVATCRVIAALAENSADQGREMASADERAGCRTDRPLVGRPNGTVRRKAVRR